MIKNITGIILAGGKSSRMGEDKAFMPFSGKPLIEIVIDNLSCFFENLIIITNKPHLYSKYKVKVYTDAVKDSGPLGGIYTGLIHSKDMYNFVFACDMPFINPALINYMLRQKGKCDAIIPELNNRLQPLFAIYSKNCIEPMKRELSKKNLKLTEFLKQVKVIRITEEETAALDPEEKCFVNINTPSDYWSIRDKVPAAVI